MLSRLLKLGILASFLFLPINLFAIAFTNGDFSEGVNGTAGWNGQIVDSVTLDPVDLGDPGADAHFVSTNDGFIELRNDFDYFEVILSQTFNINASATSAVLSFDYLWQGTNVDDTSSDADYVSAQLGTTAGIIDLFAGTSYSQLSNGGSINIDLSGFIGTEVTLGFIMSDRDFFEADIFRLGNIQLLETIAVVSGSSTGLLMFVVLFLLMGSKFGVISIK